MVHVASSLLCSIDLYHCEVDDKRHPPSPAETVTTRLFICRAFVITPKRSSQSHCNNMVPSLTRPQGQLSPAEALHLAQQAPIILKGNPKAFSASPLVSLFSAAETPELWTIYENLIITCLRTGDDDSAHLCLERLLLRFGDENERVMALKGLIKEAEATNNSELQQVLKEYEDLLQQDGTNIVSMTTPCGCQDAVLTNISILRSDEWLFCDPWERQRRQSRR